MPDSYIPDAAKQHTCAVCGLRCIPMADGIQYPGPNGAVDLIVCHRCDAARGVDAYEEAIQKLS